MIKPRSIVLVSNQKHVWNRLI